METETRSPERRERGAGAGGGRGAALRARQGWVGDPSQSWTESPGMEPVEGLEGHKAVLRRTRAREGEQEGEAGETAGEKRGGRIKGEKRGGGGGAGARGKIRQEQGRARIKAVPRLLHSQNCPSPGVHLDKSYPSSRGGNGCSSLGTWAGSCFSNFPSTPSHSLFALSLWHKALCSNPQIPSRLAPSSARTGHSHTSLAPPWREQKPREPSPFPLAGQETPRVTQGIKQPQLALILITHNTDELINLI